MTASSETGQEDEFEPWLMFHSQYDERYDRYEPSWYIVVRENFRQVPVCLSESRHRHIYRWLSERHYPASVHFLTVRSKTDRGKMERVLLLEFRESSEGESFLEEFLWDFSL